jgi:Aspartate/ornithine carbamoyltransferase, carbamoyl-P binding domain
VSRRAGRHRRSVGPHVRRDRVPRQQPGRCRSLVQNAGVPVYNGLTNECHPTQMLADFLTMHEASGKPYDALGYAFAGDCRFNIGRFAGPARQLTTCASLARTWLLRTSPSYAAAGRVGVDESVIGEPTDGRQNDHRQMVG